MYNNYSVGLSENRVPPIPVDDISLSKLQLAAAWAK